MKATLILGGLLAVALFALFGEPAALAAGLTAATEQVSHTSEPAWMIVSGAALIALGSAVRRYVP